MVKRRISAWTKSNLRQIRSTFGRYLAILLIIALGVGFFCGLRTAKEAMIRTADDYINGEANMYDFRLLSTIGFTQNDVDYFSQVDGVSSAEGAYSLDFYGTIDNATERILRAYSLTNKINLVKLTSGRMPENENECLIDNIMVGTYGIGSVITVTDNNSYTTVNALPQGEYTVVGSCCTVNQINRQRGSSELEGGSLSGFIFLLPEAFKLDRMTELLLKLNITGEIYTNEYDNSVAEREDFIKTCLEQHMSEEFDTFISDAEVELSNARDEYESNYSSYLSEKASAEKELNDAYTQLTETEILLNDTEAELNRAKQDIKNGEEEYRLGLEAYDRGYKEYSARREETLLNLSSAQSEIDNNRRTLELALSLIEQSGAVDRYNALLVRIDELEALTDSIEDHSSPEYIEAMAELEMLRHELDLIEASGAVDRYNELIASIGALDAAQKELDAARQAAETEFAKAEAELDAAKSKLDAARQQLNLANIEYAEGLVMLYDGKARYRNGKEKYDKARTEADQRFAEADNKFAEALKQIESSQDQLDEYKDIKLQTYALDRDANTGYYCFENDSNIVEGVAKVLPVFFFLVAALVCTTTMTRMIDENRTQIGTLKALGYGNGRIIMKYAIYAGSAALIGCFIGYFAGSILFPEAIWYAYKILYDFGKMTIVLNPIYGLIALIVSLLCTSGATILACRKELLSMPAGLMLPTAPKAGKRVFLEYIGFIWNKMSFLDKVAARNILRYKRRLFMMLLGIGGCTTLILTGFGVKDSVSNIVDDQFDKIMLYDYTINFSRDLSEGEMSSFKKETAGLLNDCVFVITDSADIKTDSGYKSATIIATNDEDIKNEMHFGFDGENLPVPKKGGILISEKLASISNVKEGDMLTLRLSETRSIDLRVDGIFENYVMHFIFMSGETYSSEISADVGYRTAYARTEGEIHSVSSDISKMNNVSLVTITQDFRLIIDDTLNSMNYIVGLVIICACTLALIVAYNLGNISVTERTREIATLKVLGFYPNETSAYVSRENIVITIIGAILGLPFGVLLTRFVVAQIKVDIVAFSAKISIPSFAYAFFMTILLSVLVSFALRKKINRIDPAESLKSID